MRKPAFRRIGTGCSIALICFAVGLMSLWWRSFWHVDRIGWDRTGTSLFAETRGGQRLEYKWHVSGIELPAKGFWHSTEPSDGKALSYWKSVPGSEVHVQRWGFAFVSGERWGDEHLSLYLPTPALAATAVIVAVAPTVIRVVTSRRRARRWGFAIASSANPSPPVL